MDLKPQVYHQQHQTTRGLDFFNFRVSDEGRGYAMAEPIRLQDLFHGRGVTRLEGRGEKKTGNVSFYSLYLLQV